MSNISKLSSKSPNKGSNDKAPTGKSEPTIRRHSEFFFDNTLIAIQVEDTLFNVHKYQLLKSKTFSDMFKVPKAKGDEPEEGSSPEHPIVMEGVKASDFVALLKVLYARWDPNSPVVLDDGSSARNFIMFPSHFSANQPEPEASLIIPSFRLANMWDFSELRAFLIPLAEKHLNDIDKILFAREFDIKDWLAPAHIRLCQREEKLTTEEARKLGVDSMLLIARLGLQNPPLRPKLVSGNRYCTSCVGLTYNSSYNCNNCQGSNAYFYYNGSGTLMTGQKTLTSGHRYCTNCIGFTYSGSSHTCSNCHGSSGNYGYFAYNGAGTLMTGPPLETEVEKWVKDGCVFKK